MADNKVQPDPIVRLYNNIKNEYDLPDFNTFKADMSDSNKVKRLHTTLINDGYEVPKYDVFSVDMGLKKKVGNLPSLVTPSKFPSAADYLQQGRKIGSGEIFREISASIPKTAIQPVVKNTLKDAAIKDKNNNNSYLGAMWNNVVASAERLAGGAARLVQKFDSSPTARIQEAVDKAASSVTGVNYEALREKETTDKIKNFIGKARTSASSKEYEQGLAKGFDVTDGIGLDDIKSLGAILPSMLVDIGAGASTGGSTFAIQGYDDALSTIDSIPEGKNMSETTRTAFGFGGAIISGVLEKLGMDGILKSGTATKYVTAKILKEAAGELAKKGVKVTAEQFEKTIANKATQMLTKTALKNTGKVIAKSGGKEAFTEFSQEGANDLMKLAANKIENKKIFDEEELKNTAASRYLNAAAMGGIFGGGLGSLSSRTKNVQAHIENEIKNAKTQEDIDNLVNEINQGVEEGVISKNDGELFKLIVDENINKPSSLDIKNEKEVKLSDIDGYINSLDKRDRLYNDKLNELNKEKNEIISYYDNLSKKSQEDEEIPFDDGKSVSEENKSLDDELRTALDYRFYEKGLDSGDEWEREDSRKFLTDPKKYFENKIEFAKESLSNNPNDESAKMLLEDNMEKLRVFNEITNKYKQNKPDVNAGKGIPSELIVDVSSIPKETTEPVKLPITEEIPEVTVEGTRRGYEVIAGNEANSIGDIRQEAAERRNSGEKFYIKETVKDGKKIFTLVDTTVYDEFGRPGFKAASVTVPENSRLNAEALMGKLKSELGVTDKTNLQYLDKMTSEMKSEQGKSTEVIVTEDIESKKADIEKRREEELNKLPNKGIFFTEENGKIVKTLAGDKVDAKYDAELSALKSGKQEVKPTEVKAKEEKTFAQKDLDRAEAKKIHSRVSEMEPPIDAEQVALRYLSEGGKVSQDAINEVSGTTKRASLNTGRRELKTAEAKARDYEGGKESLDDLAHRLWENSGQEISERDIKDALMSEIANNNTRLDASKAYLERYNIEYQEEQYYERFIEEEAELHAKVQEELERDLRKPLEEETEGMSSEEHINNLINQYEAEIKRENKQLRSEGKGEAVEEISSRDTGKKATEEKSIEQAYKDLTRNEKRQIINSKFDELIKVLKIEKICPT